MGKVYSRCGQQLGPPLACMFRARGRGDGRLTGDPAGVIVVALGFGWSEPQLGFPIPQQSLWRLDPARIAATRKAE